MTLAGLIHASPWRGSALSIERPHVRACSLVRVRVLKRGAHSPRLTLAGPLSVHGSSINNQRMRRGDLESYNEGPRRETLRPRPPRNGGAFKGEKGGGGKG